VWLYGTCKINNARTDGRMEIVVLEQIEALVGLVDRGAVHCTLISRYSPFVTLDGSFFNPDISSYVS
jgi:hypothetical protein